MKLDAGKVIAGIAGIFCLVSPLVVLAYQLMTPSDGARISKSVDAWTRAGVLVHVYPGEQSGLVDGDLVSGVNGQDLETRAGQLFSLEKRDQVPDTGQTVYRVIRSGEAIDVPIRTVSQPIGAIARAHWGAILFAIVTQALTGFVYLRRPNSSPARALFIWGMTLSHFYVWALFYQVSDLVHPAGFWIHTIPADLLWLGNWAASVHIALTFPQPFSSVQRKPTLLLIPYLAVFGFYAGFLLVSKAATDSLLVWIGAWGIGHSLIPVILMPIFLWLQIRHYRLDLSEVSRTQIRSMIFVSIILTINTILFYFIPPLIGMASLDSNLVSLILILFPASLAFSILRYHLFDFDIIIRKTLIYAILTAALAGVYLTSVIVFQAGISQMGGEQSSAAIVLSTLTIAALFTPLRRRIQTVIDRRFYRERYNAENTLRRFASAIRNEVDLEHLTEHLAMVVQEAMQPSSVSVWVNDPGKQTNLQHFWTAMQDG